MKYLLIVLIFGSTPSDGLITGWYHEYDNKQLCTDVKDDIIKNWEPTNAYDVKESRLVVDCQPASR